MSYQPAPASQWLAERRRLFPALVQNALLSHQGIVRSPEYVLRSLNDDECAYAQSRRKTTPELERKAQNGWKAPLRQAEGEFDALLSESS